MEVLSGGREDAIYRDKDTVVRPLKPWSRTVHQLLRHLHNNGFSHCPLCKSIEENHERLTFIHGDTYNYPLKGNIASVEALVSAGKMLREMHDASADFLITSNEPTWMLPAQQPSEVICHGDFTPYNVALKGNTISGVFDFDTAHPAPRVWDLAYSVYCWAPFKTDPFDKLGTLETQMVRTKQFLDAYGANAQQRNMLVDTMIKRLEALISYMSNEAEKGDEQFSVNIEDGHCSAYHRDIIYLEENRHHILQAIN
ncbi:phosphotransferase [Veronia nyctiphanis]|uniref:Phosphotransferase n=1 Tax=Veronia nyctiphanis TaxID=1278244 RepID=A0A4Q0YI71_9GAMM|nr:aminoglycoside phosphotransferase family protein [Veronia nyctiphanis]RXJ69464.1 phosphotransferase [Veronia nyctiphanis]